MIFKNQILDRSYCGLCILISWAFAAIMVWVAFDRTDLPLIWRCMGYFLAGVTPVMAGFLTAIMWRYTLTGNEFPD